MSAEGNIKPNDDTKDKSVNVQFPSEIKNTQGSDLLTPLQALERGLSVLPGEGAVSAGKTAGNTIKAIFAGTPKDVSIIEASSTALSKYWAAVIGGLGGATVITAGISNFWTEQKDPGIRIGLIGGTAGLLIAVVIAIGIIVACDVKGRAAGMAAMYQARASVAGQFLRESLPASQLVSAAATGPVNQNGEEQPSGKSVKTTSQDDTLSSALLLCLAAGSARAQVLDKNTNQAAHLAGVRQVDGKIELFLIRQTDKQSTWRSPDEVTVTEFTYSS